VGDGSHWITVAQHSFPPGNGTVHHP
jgi:hypothetical protein